MAREHQALNLAQGLPDFPAPDFMKEAAARAIRGDFNQYAITFGSPRLREALAAKYHQWYGLEVDPDAEVTITCGVTEGLMAALMAILDPGDELIILTPFYEAYASDALLAGAVPVYVALEPGQPLDPDRLRAAVTPRTRALLLNTPNNPTGRMLTRGELETIRELCLRADLVALSDEVYEHLHYELPHVPLATLEGMRERTITLSGASKTFSVTGWRLGWIVAPPHLTAGIRKVHDYLTVGAAHPLQEAMATGLELAGKEFYLALVDEYRARRDRLHATLLQAGFDAALPDGAYYILADYRRLVQGSALERLGDEDFALWLIREARIATVPGSVFHGGPGHAPTTLRFVYCRSDASLGEAERRLAGLRERVR